MSFVSMAVGDMSAARIRGSLGLVVVGGGRARPPRRRAASGVVLSARAAAAACGGLGGRRGARAGAPSARDGGSGRVDGGAWVGAPSGRWSVGAVRPRRPRRSRGEQEAVRRRSWTRTAGAARGPRDLAARRGACDMARQRVFMTGEP